MTPSPPELEHLIARIELEQRGTEVGRRLEEAVRIADQLRSTGDALLDHYVGLARAEGRSWTDIGAVLGITKQGAQQRFAQPAAIEPWPARFSQAAQAVVARAVDEARALGHRYLGTEHLLLALCSTRSGLAGRCLAELGVSPEEVETKIVALVGRGENPPNGSLGVTPRTKRALEAARREARHAGHRCPEPEHLLLALYSLPQGVAARILKESGATEERARATLADMLAGEAPELAERIRRPKRRRLSRR